MTQTDMTATAQVLLVEDNPADVRLTREILAEGRIPNRIHVAPDGDEALAYLRGSPPHEDRTLPDLILLDLNLPRRQGHEVLEAIKSDPALKSIPVVILTSSRRRSDVLESYRLHANCYVAKPRTLEDFSDVVRSIEDFWLRVTSLPTRV
jgi:chemotaxis family two-component system response regulator Rcp1